MNGSHRPLSIARLLLIAFALLCVAAAQQTNDPFLLAHAVRNGAVAATGEMLALDPLLDAATCARGGRIAFVSRIAGAARNQGIFVADGNGVHAVAIGCGGLGGSGVRSAGGDPAPGGGTFAGMFQGTAFAPSLNERGDALFVADVFGGPTLRALFCARSGGAIERIAGPGDAAPGGGTFASVGPGTHLRVADVLFVAKRHGQSGAELFLWRAGMLSAFKLLGDALPQGGYVTGLATEELSFVDGTTIPIGPLPCADACGSVVYRAIGGGGAPTSGILAHRSGIDAWWLRAGERAADGSTFVGFGAPHLGGDGRGSLACCVFADCAEPSGMTSGWFVGMPGAWRRAIGFFDPVDGGQCLGLAISRGPFTPLDGKGDLVVWCDLSLQGGQDRIVLCRANGTKQVLLRRGDAAPQQGTLGELGGWPSLDDSGRCVVAARTLGAASSNAHFVLAQPEPRIAIAPCATLGASMSMHAHGVPPAMFAIGASTIQAAMECPPFGTLAIGPDPIWMLTGIESFLHPQSWSRAWTMPDDPSLEGVALHFQAVAIEAGGMRFLAPVATRLVR